MTPIIQSLLETDQYKFTMWQTLLHRHPESRARYRFVCRSAPEFPLAELYQDVEEQLDALCTLQFSEDELQYLGERRYIKSDFVDYLSVFRFQRKFIQVSVDGDALVVTAVGPQIHVMGFEIFLLAIVSELYFRRFESPETLAEGRRRLDAKIAYLKEELSHLHLAHSFDLTDFGLRRRFSRDWHEEVVVRLNRDLPGVFRGTSNMYLAKKYGIVPMGTMAHEYLQSYQAFGVRLRDFQTAALEDWVHEYRGDLGIALTDTIGMDAFLNDFDLYFAKLFDGLRHDSGDPFVWGEKALAHYQKLRIDPHTKRFVFSDALDFETALALYRAFGDRIQIGFGIGTFLTNDLGHKPLNIVAKLVECNGQPVAKLSDAPGKTLCDDETFLAYLRQVFNVRAPQKS